MAAIAGRGGKVVSAGGTVAYVEEWAINISDEALNVSGLGDTSQKYVGRGLPDNSWSITFRALDNSDAGTGTFRTTALANGTGHQLKLYQDGSKYWDSGAGNAITTSFSQSASVDGVVTGSAAGVFNGSPTYT